MKLFVDAIMDPELNQSNHVNSIFPNNPSVEINVPTERPHTKQSNNQSDYEDDDLNEEELHDILLTIDMKTVTREIEQEKEV